MSEFPSGPESRAARLRRLAAKVRPVHVAAVLALAVGLGVVGLGAVALPGPRALVDGERLHIEVVAPVEPDIAAGSVMDVGELVDGFQGLPPTPVVETVAWAPSDDWDDRDGEFEPPPPRRFEEPVIEAPVQPERPRSRPVLERWFGFDAPRRDYRAEREARRADRERRMEYEYGRERDRPRRYRSDAGRDRDRDDDRRFEDGRRGDDDRWREPPPLRDDFPPADRWD